MTMTEQGPRAVLSARGLRRDFGGFVAVNNVDLDVHDGQIHALIGPNGAGKTTVFHLLTKFLPPSAGRIELLGHDITRTSPAKVAQQSRRIRIAQRGRRGERGRVPGVPGR